MMCMLSNISKWIRRVSKIFDCYHKKKRVKLKQNLYCVFEHKWYVTPVDKTEKQETRGFKNKFNDETQDQPR